MMNETYGQQMLQKLGVLRILIELLISVREIKERPTTPFTLITSIKCGSTYNWQLDFY